MRSTPCLFFATLGAVMSGLSTNRMDYPFAVFYGLLSVGLFVLAGAHIARGE